MPNLHVLRLEFIIEDIVLQLEEQKYLDKEGSEGSMS